MSRDPFGEMQRKNPVTPDELPVAPMSVAERILGRRAGRAVPGWVLAAAAAFLVAAVGGGTLLWLGGGDAVPVGSGGTTTTVGPVTTEDPTVTSVAMVESSEVVYFFVEQIGAGWAGGPYLIPLSVDLHVSDGLTGHERTLDVAYAALSRLFQGVEGVETQPIGSLSSAIPLGTEVRGLGIEEATGVLTVDLSAEFASGGGSASMLGRIGQVVHTLTRIDGINGIRFEIEGVPTTVFGGEGVVVDDPATRDGFESLLPAVMIESPAYNATVANPLIARGTANVFEATVGVQLRDGSGLLIFEGFATATCGTGCRGEWEISIPYEVPSEQVGKLIVFESSAEDGSPTNLREHRVLLTPAAGTGDTTTTSIAPMACSGHLWETPFEEQPGLPESVAEKRAAIWSAAVACDWDELQSLLGSDFSYSFGGQDDSIDAPIHHWQGLEDQGEDPIRFLAEGLNQPFGTIESEGITYYVWPSAHTRPWGEVDAAVRAELLRLYDEEDLADFEAFGAYVGYRIGITADGKWMYFIAGD